MSTVAASNLAVPLTEIPSHEMEYLNRPDVMKRHAVTAIPVFYSRGIGVWPRPCNDCIIVQEVEKDEI